ncbi:EamA family transporter [candidate division GN15 bacterium]|nr:EamA family transporter [candidate division GN15 bacterium]
MTQVQDKPAVNALLILVLGAATISFAPIFVKWIGEARMGPTAMAFWRTLLGAITLCILTFVRGRSLRLPKRLYKFALLAGFVFFLDLFVWHRSIIFAGAGMATILGNTQVFGSALLSALFFKERLTVKFFIAAISAMFGVVLLVGVLADEVEFSSRYIEGIIFGLATGICYASYIISLKAAGHKERIPDVVAFVAWVASFSALFLGIATLIEGGRMVPPDTLSWVLLISLGILVQALAWWAIVTALATIDASRAGLVLLLQPTLAMVWGVLFFAEQFTVTQVVGAVITLTAIYYGGVRK